MSAAPPPMPSSGWHPDPQDPTKLRYWDGTQWTEHRMESAPPPTTPTTATPSAPQTATSTGCGVLGCLSIVGIVLGLLVLAFIAISLNRASDAAAGAMRNDCVTRVAEWVGVTVSEVTSIDVSDENPSGLAWDFRGGYPGGEWACGGPAGERAPSSVMVYPGGRGALLENDPPRQIYSGD